MSQHPEWTELYRHRMAKGSITEGANDGISQGEKAFMYLLAFTGFLFVLWMKREAVSETRRRVTRHLREIDAPVDDNNWALMAGTSVGQY